ncbi:MAG: aconitase/3-isopropylmalate dehydratase large subunit family protein [Planctomycetota bacterium]
MSGTIATKLLSRCAGRPVRPGEIVTVEPDRVMSHDNTAFVLEHFLLTGATKVWDPDKVVVAFDHCVPAIDPRHAQNHADARAFVAEQGITRFFDAGVGVCHQLMCEQGLALPGQLVLGADSHSTLYGALNAFGVPINRTEMAGIWATGTIWLKVPEAIRVVLEGELRPGVSAKDAVLKLLRDLRADGATYRSLEFAGEGVATLSIASRMTLANMAVELGAKAGVFPCDAATRAYLAGRTSEAWEPVGPDPDARYEREVRLDLSALQPQVARPHEVDNVTDLGEVRGVKVHQAYLGSCTNGRLEDLEVAARILGGRQVKPGVRLVIYPASSEVQREAEAAGVLDALVAAGGELMSASCGPCFGAVGATLQAGEVCISSSNRNFCGRMGSPEAQVYLASPAVVAASCLAGEIADPRDYL